MTTPRSDLGKLIDPRAVCHESPTDRHIPDPSTSAEHFARCGYCGAEIDRPSRDDLWWDRAEPKP